MSNLYKNYAETLECVGIKPISDDTCCKVLAWVYVCGGSYEVNYNVKLLTDIQYAQRRLNISGACVPDGELMPLLKLYVKDIEEGKAEWREDFMKKYNLPDYAF